MSAITDICITIPEGCCGHRAEASFRYYGLTVNHVTITEFHGEERSIQIFLPHRKRLGEQWADENPPILQPTPRLEAEIKTAILRAYRAEMARKKAA